MLKTSLESSRKQVPIPVPLLMHHGSDVLGLSGQLKADRLETGIGELIMMDGLANVITRILFMVMLCVCLMVVTVPLNLSMLTQSALLLLLSFSVNLFT